MTDKLIIIMYKLDELIRKDVEFKVYGSNEPWGGHKYILYETLEEEIIKTIEDDINTKLPIEYSEFISKIADGGVGPYYGLYNSYKGFSEAIRYINIVKKTRVLLKTLLIMNFQKIY